MAINRPPKSVLIIANQQIGDVLLSTCVLHDMRLAWPDAVIDVLVYKGTAGILAGNPDCNAIIEVAHRPNKAGYWQLVKRIFRRYDLAVTTQGNDRAHQYAFLAASRRYGLIPDGTRRHWWKRAANRAWTMLDEANTHTVAQNSQLSDCLGIQKHFKIIPPHDPNAEQILSAFIPFNWLHESYVVIHPMPMWRYKQWTHAGWLALIAHLIKQGKKVLITGGPNATEQAYCLNLAQAFAENVTSLAGNTSFATLATLLQHAAAYIGPDTATTHLAAACGTPTIALFGPTNPVKWGPWPSSYVQASSPWQKTMPYQRVGNVTLLQGLGDCVPCHRAGCDNHNNSESNCLTELSIERVITAVDIALLA